MYLSKSKQSAMDNLSIQNCSELHNIIKKCIENQLDINDSITKVNKTIDFYEDKDYQYSKVSTILKNLEGINISVLPQMYNYLKSQ